MNSGGLGKISLVNLNSVRMSSLLEIKRSQPHLQTFFKKRVPKIASSIQLNHENVSSLDLSQINEKDTCKDLSDCFIKGLRIIICFFVL